MAKTSHEEAVLAAKRIFRNSGYAGFSLAELAKVLGIRKASLYSRFTGKEEIALEAITLASKDLAQFVPSEGPWHQQYSEFVEFLCNHLVAAKRCIGLHMGYGDAPAKVDEAVVEFFELLVSIPEGILLQHFEPGQARAIAEDCIGALDGATIWLVIRNDPGPIRRAAKQQITLAMMADGS